MENIKNFLGTVMTTTGGQPNSSGPSRHPATGSAQTMAGTSSLVSNVDLKNINNQLVTVPAAIGGGRNRTESESSVASDISSVSAAEMVDGRNKQLMNKRKDSEPYFWIM